MPIESIISFAFASTLLSIAPGPDNIFVLVQSALYGRKSGILITLGLCTGLLVHTTAVAFGVAALFRTSVTAFTLLKIVGAIYLAYLAWQMYRETSKRLEARESNFRSNGAMYRRGIIMNITNPKVSIFFLAFLPQFASPEYGPVTTQMFILGGIFICVAMLIFSAVALLADAIGEWLNSWPKARVYLCRIAGAVFAGLALKLAISSAPGG